MLIGETMYLHWFLPNTYVLFICFFSSIKSYWLYIHLWLFLLAINLNFWKHFMHSYGVSPVCTLMWVFNWWRWVNLLAHTWHYNKRIDFKQCFTLVVVVNTNFLGLTITPILGAHNCYKSYVCFYWKT